MIDEPEKDFEQGELPGTVCPRSSDPFYIIPYYIKWVTTSWTDGIETQ